LVIYNITFDATIVHLNVEVFITALALRLHVK